MVSLAHEGVGSGLVGCPTNVGTLWDLKLPLFPLPPVSGTYACPDQLLPPSFDMHSSPSYLQPSFLVSHTVPLTLWDTSCTLHQIVPALPLILATAVTLLSCLKPVYVA